MTDELSDQELMNRYYPDEVPILIKVAFKHGHGRAIIELQKNVNFNPDLSIGPIVREAILGLCLSNCNNRYCLVMHSSKMISIGMTLDDIGRLIRFQRLPQYIDEREKWENSLRRIVTIFREPAVAQSVYNSLLEFHSSREISDIGKIIASSLLHKFVLEIYNNEISVELEPILFSTVSCGNELIRFISEEAGEPMPIYTICCICKDIKGQKEWLPIEEAFSQLPSDTRFSHGVCDRCVTRWETA